MNLKPSGSMETMRSDMSGAATILCVKSLAELKVKQNTAVIPLTENMLSGNAYRREIYTGHTRTDRRDREYRRERKTHTCRCHSIHGKGRPELIVDIATLTGARCNIR